jgi:hypothetical protein
MLLWKLHDISLLLLQSKKSQQKPESDESEDQNIQCCVIEWMAFDGT